MKMKGSVAEIRYVVISLVTNRRYPEGVRRVGVGGEVVRRVTGRAPVPEWAAIHFG